MFAGGTGNPYFTTDTAAALRASEVQCDVLLKATQVDGVYDADPKIHTDAKRYERISYDEVLSKNLHVMDLTAVTLLKESNIPVIVFKLTNENAFVKALEGSGKLTVIEKEKR